MVGSSHILAIEMRAEDVGVGLSTLSILNSRPGLWEGCLVYYGNLQVLNKIEPQKRSVWDRGRLKLGKQLKEAITRVLRLW